MALLASLKAKALAALALFAAGALWVWRLVAGVKRTARLEAKVQEQGAVLEAVAKRKEIDDEVDDLSGDAARKRLHDEFERPG